MVFKGIDEDYADQVTAEHKINVKQANGSTVQKWVQKNSHGANHYLDAEVYAMAAADIRGARTWHMDRYDPEKERTVDGQMNPPPAPEEQWIRENELEGWV